MIESLLKNKNEIERANIKAQEIVKLEHRGEFTKSNLKIEIQDLKKIDGGVEVFVRAWKGKKQCGFGSDGTVEIERIRIFNPPILVPDENGDVIREKADSITGEVRVTRYREDPIEAVRESLSHTIGLVAKDGKNIQKGKVGNTTSTFYPNPGTGTAPIDGTVRRTHAGESFTNIRGNTGTEARNTETDDAVILLQANNTGATNWTAMGRSLVGFATGAVIGSGENVTSATLSFRGTTVSNHFSQSVVIDRNVPTNQAQLATGDYNLAEWDGVEQATNRIALSSWSTSGYNDFTLNATGISNIAKGSGNSWYGGRCSADFDNSSPSPTNNFARAEAYFADQTGTTNDPKLVVVHEVASFTSSPMMHMMGISGGLM